MPPIVAALFEAKAKKGEALALALHRDMNSLTRNRVVL